MVLYGASGHAKVIIDILERNNVNISNIIDDNNQIKEIINYSVNRHEESKIKDSIIISIGNNNTRKMISEKLKNNNFGIAIHPTAIIDKTLKIYEGTVIMANVVINSSVTIGKHCIINTNSVVEHDVLIGDFVHISPSTTLCGNVSVGEGTHIGAGATIIPNINIGKWCTIGAGSIIIKDVPDFAVIYGNPGKVKKIKKNEE